jgi:hypothetical protein
MNHTSQSVLTATSGYKPQTTQVVSIQRLIEPGETAMQGSFGGFKRWLWCAIGVLLISIGLAVSALQRISHNMAAS